MRRDWQADELAVQWTLLPGERELLANKTGATRLGFAMLLKFFQCEARFPQSRQEVPLERRCLSRQASRGAGGMLCRVRLARPGDQVPPGANPVLSRLPRSHAAGR